LLKSIHGGGCFFVVSLRFLIFIPQFFQFLEDLCKFKPVVGSQILVVFSVDLVGGPFEVDILERFQVDHLIRLERSYVFVIGLFRLHPGDPFRHQGRQGVVDGGEKDDHGYCRNHLSALLHPVQLLVDLPGHLVADVLFTGVSAPGIFIPIFLPAGR